jgi:hypothetical protein
VADRETTLIDLVGSESTLKNAVLVSDHLMLTATPEQEAKAERRFVWPRSEQVATTVLELEARAPAGKHDRQLVIDLYDESGSIQSRRSTSCRRRN